MSFLVVVLVLGLAFSAFALLGPAERSRSCDHGRVGDPKCERCPVDELLDEATEPHARPPHPGGGP